MKPDTANLVALIGSRICHDLISPVGAVGNGLELIQMTNTLDEPEIQLITESVVRHDFASCFSISPTGWPWRARWWGATK